MMMKMEGKRSYPKEIVLHEQSIESPDSSIQEKEKGEEEWHVLHTLGSHHCFLKPI